VKAKLPPSERVFTCESCAHGQDRDLNAALNLAVMAQHHAQAEGLDAYVARTGRETLNARGGQVRLAELGERSSVKREGPLGSSQQRELPAAAL
jgi:transposase